jgi:hypothetical protein
MVAQRIVRTGFATSPDVLLPLVYTPTREPCGQPTMCHTSRMRAIVFSVCLYTLFQTVQIARCYAF